MCRKTTLIGRSDIDLKRNFSQDCANRRKVKSPGAWIDPALACIFANFTTSFIEVPIDTVKQRLQAGIPRQTFRGLWANSELVSSLRSLTKLGGIRSLYRSYLPYMLRTLPFEMIEFSVFESMNDAVKKHYKMNRRCEWITYLSLGAFAGAIATIVTMPIDNMKTRINVLGESFSDSPRMILKCHGFSGFFRGITPRLATHIPSGAIYFLVYAGSKSFLRKIAQEKEISET